MKILYITQFFYPERVAAAFRAFDNSAIWFKLGARVKILTGFPNFPTGKIFEGYEVRNISQEYLNGIEIIRSRVIAKPNTNLINRAISYLSFPFYTIKNMFLHKEIIGTDHDIILATSGTVFAPIAGYVYSKKIKKPFVLELRDITYKQMLANGASQNSIVYKLVRFLELYLCKKADKIITVTHGFKEELVSEGIFEDKIDVIPNGVIINAEEHVEYTKQSSNIKENDEIVISYFGTFGKSQDITSVIEILNTIHIHNKHIKLLLIGDGAEKQKIIDFLKNKGQTNLTILNSMSQDELEEYYIQSHLCLVVLKNNDFFKNTVPSKVYQIMARKKPVIFFGPRGEASNIIAKANAGFSILGKTKKEATEEVSNKLNDFLNNQNIDELLSQIGQNGFDYIKQNFDRNQLAEQYHKILSQVSTKIH